MTDYYDVMDFIDESYQESDDTDAMGGVLTFDVSPGENCYLSTCDEHFMSNQQIREMEDDF